jgi:TPR repeat protein
MNLNEIKSRAKAGDAEALYELAVAYRTGDGVPLSVHKSVSLLTDSADRKYLPAMYDLAKYFLVDSSPYFDVERGLKVLQEACDMGYPLAEAHMAYLLQEGMYIEQDEQKALTMFEHAASDGCPEAMVSLGDSYINGRGVEKDYKAAEEWYRKALEHGEEYDYCREQLKRAIEADEEKTEMRLEMERADCETAEEKEFDAIVARARDDVPEDLCKVAGIFITGRYGQYLYFKKDMAQAVECFKEAIKLGYVPAAFELGKLLYYGYEGHEPDTTEAMHWLEYAAERGHASAMTNLAYCYQNVAGNSEKAVEWLEKAVAAGDKNAFALLSTNYMVGIGVAKDPAKAFALAKAGAEADDAESERVLGTYYLNGTGTERDVDAAEQWLIKAVNNGSLKALVPLGRIYLGRFDNREPDLELAEDLWQQAAERGDAEAAYEVGCLYSDIGNTQASRDMLEYAARIGSSEAAEKLDRDFGNTEPE